MVKELTDTTRDSVFAPREPESIAETGLGVQFLANLALKIMYLEGDILGYELADRMRLPHAGVVEELLSYLKREQLCEVKGTGGVGQGAGIGRAVYRYKLGDKGRAVAREAMQRSQYAGPAPVPLAQYIDGIHSQPPGELSVHRDGLERALSHLVIDEDTITHLGAAVNSRRSVFLFGPPGDGKTAISESVGRLVLGGTVYIPYAVETGSQVIKAFDPVNHVVVEEVSNSDNNNHRDRRWIRIRRPVIISGGELTLVELDLIYEENSKYYEAPLQMKANGGMLLIDDFGRQQTRPRDLLNRWIVPLEKRVDFLTLHTGQKIEVPFDVLIVFATNLAPRELVDEAFLRRIPHKIEITDPTWDEYRRIFRRECQQKDVPYDEDGLAYLIREHYMKEGRPKRGCHPRDLIDQLRDIARFLDVPPRLTEDLIDQACRTYFVDFWDD
ncbi:MAG: ATP-binding protein [Anaerolineae bacterium]|jgi:predicted ATPase with chaperone activity